MSAYLRAIAFLFLIVASPAWCADPPDFKENWLELFKTGDPRERSLAIESLGLPDCKTKEGMNYLHFLGKVGGQDDSPLVRETALTQLRQSLSADYHGECKADDELLNVLAGALNDQSPRVREECVRILGMARIQHTIPDIAALLRDPEFTVRQQAAAALGRIGDEQALPVLLELLNKRTDWLDVFVQQEAIYSIRNILSANSCSYIARSPRRDKRKDKYFIDPELLERIKRAMIRVADDPYLRREAFRFFSAYATSGAMDILQSAIKDPDPITRELAHRGISLLDSQAVNNGACGYERISSALHDASPGIRSAALSELRNCRGQIDGAVLAADIVNGINDASQEVSTVAVDVAPAFGGFAVMNALVGQFGKEPYETRKKAMEGLLSIVRGEAEPSGIWERIPTGSGQKIPRKNRVKPQAAMSITGQAPTAGSDAPPRLEAIPKVKSLEAEGKAVEILLKRFPSLPVFGKVTAIETLDKLDDARIGPFAKTLLDDPQPWVRSSAIVLARKFGIEAIAPQLFRFAHGKDLDLRQTAIYALIDAEALPEEYSLKRLADSSDPVVRASLVGEINSRQGSDEFMNKNRKKLSELMLHMLDDSDPKVHREVARYFRNNPDKRSIDKLAGMLATDGVCFDVNTVYSGIAEALAVQGDIRGNDALYEIAKGRCDVKNGLDDQRKRSTAAANLRKFKDSRAIQLLCELLKEGTGDDSQLISNLGATRDKSAAPCIIAYGKKRMHGSEVMRSLGNIASPETLDFLKESLDTYQYDQMVYLDIVSAIWKIPGTRSLDILIEVFLKGKKPLYDSYTLKSPLVSRVMTDQDALVYLLNAAGKDPERLGSLAISLIENHAGSNLNRRIENLTNDKDKQTRKGAIIALGACKDSSSTKILERLAIDEDEEIRKLARLSLERIQKQK